MLVTPSPHDYASEVDQEGLPPALQWCDDDSPERLRSTFLRQLLVVSGIVGHAQSFQVQGLIICIYRKRFVVAIARERIALAVVNSGTLNRPGFSRHLASSLRNAFQTLPVTADC